MTTEAELDRHSHKEAGSGAGAGRGGKDPRWSLQREPGPADTLISDCGPQSQEKIKFCRFKPLLCGIG